MTGACKIRSGLGRLGKDGFLTVYCCTGTRGYQTKLGHLAGSKQAKDNSSSFRKAVNPFPQVFVDAKCVHGLKK